MKKTLFLVLFALLGLASAWAYDFSAVAPTGQTLYYTITSSSSHTVSVVPPYSTGWSSSNTPTGSLTIPSTVTYGGTAYSVTAIGDYAFHNCSRLTRGTIPNSVTSIGSYAFADCTSLASVTIPNSVTSIGSYAFDDCSGLTSVTIPNSVTSIGSYAFSGCSRLTHVAFNARNCNNGTFSGCTNISTFTLGDSVQRIPAYLCYGLAITSITIPNSVTSIGLCAFEGCSGLTGSLTIPNSVTSIGGAAFYGCSGLTGSLTIPNSVTSIESYTFYGCSGLTGSLIISDSVASIGERAFYGCGRLKYLSLGRDVYSIGYEAFYGCSSITEITSKATLAPTLGEDAFEGVWSGIPVNIPCGSLAPYQDRWSYFSNFVECGAEEGIDDVEVPAYEVSSEQGGIVVKAAAGERVRVFDIAGRLLYQGRIEEEPWHYRVEKSGVYLVQIADSPAQKVVVIE